jgi:hypothetical protein
MIASPTHKPRTSRTCHEATNFKKRALDKKYSSSVSQYDGWTQENIQRYMVLGVLLSSVIGAAFCLG